MMRQYQSQVMWLLFALVSLVISGCAENSDRTRGEEFLAAGMYQEAMTVLQLHIQSSPTDAEAHYLLGKALLGVGKENSAKEEFSRATQLSSKFAKEIGNAFLDIGLVFLNKSEQRDILYGHSLLRVAVENDPELASKVSENLRNRGLVIVDKEPEAAESLLNDAVRLDPKFTKDEAVQFALARIPSDPSSKKSRLEDFIAIFPESSQSSRAYLELGKCYYALSGFENAKIRLQYVCDNFPESIEAQDATRLLETISEHEEDLQRIEVQRKEAEAKAELDRIETDRKAAVERERMRAQAEQAERDAALSKLEREEKARLDKEKRELEQRRVRAAGPFLVRAYASGSGSASILVNGKKVVYVFMQDSGWVEITEHLHVGSNSIVFYTENTSPYVRFELQLKQVDTILWQYACGDGDSRCPTAKWGKAAFHKEYSLSID